MTTAPIPLRELSFPAYIADQRSAGRVAFSSLMHFFEAEKFREKSPDVYRSIVDSTSLRETSKISRRNKDAWRGDWLGVRGRVMLCGMRYASWFDPTPERWSNISGLTIELQELGFPEKFSHVAATEFQRFSEDASWCFFGIDLAPQDVVGKKINAIHRKTKRVWYINHWLGRHTSWRLHEWALSQYIPMRYFGAPGERLTPELIDRISSLSAHSCVFEQRGGKGMDLTIRQLRGLKRPIEIEFFTPAQSADMV